jgi:hypothetical protein
MSGLYELSLAPASAIDDLGVTPLFVATLEKMDTHGVCLFVTIWIG